ncbi:MAG: biopolymer transporter ExbD, partial [Burkholderiaceae bacterium]
MPFGGFERHGGPSQPMSEINVTPLVDVMLVLLVIFIITAPLLSYAIKLDLPNDPAPAAELAPATVKLSVDESGQIFWDTDRVS